MPAALLAGGGGYLNNGNVKIKNGDFKGAVKLYDKAIKQDPAEAPHYKK
jgi:Tfp pilus assembly protein PilF